MGNGGERQRAAAPGEGAASVRPQQRGVPMAAGGARPAAACGQVPAPESKRAGGRGSSSSLTSPGAAPHGSARPPRPARSPHPRSSALFLSVPYCQQSPLPARAAPCPLQQRFGLRGAPARVGAAPRIGADGTRPGSGSAAPPESFFPAERGER